MGRIEKQKRQLIKESNKRVLNEQEEKFLVSGTKFNMFGSHRIDIKVIDKTTSEIIISVGGEGSSEKEAYDKAVKELEYKVFHYNQTNFQNNKDQYLKLQPPTIDKLEKTN